MPPNIVADDRIATGLSLKTYRGLPNSPQKTNYGGKKMDSKKYYAEHQKISDLLADLQSVRQDEKHKDIKGLIRKTMNLIRKNAKVIAEANV
jgi:hypothetical protein